MSRGISICSRPGKAVTPHGRVGSKVAIIRMKESITTEEEKEKALHSLYSYCKQDQLPNGMQNIESGTVFYVQIQSAFWVRFSTRVRRYGFSCRMSVLPDIPAYTQSFVPLKEEENYAYYALVSIA